MKYGMCSGCLCDAHFTEVGHDDTGRMFKVYFCPKCKNYTRVFDAPQTEREAADHALVTAALSAARRPIQLRMFAAGRVSED